MKEFLIALLIIAIIATAIVLYGRNQKKNVVNPFDECEENNKALPEGAECTNCIPEGSQIPSFAGTIVNGVCTKVQPPPPPPPTSDTIKISNSNGARVYTYYNNTAGAIFVPQNKWIPLDTQTTYSKTITTGVNVAYYNTPYGWLLATDVSILNTNK